MRPNAVLTRASIIKAGDALDAATVVYGAIRIAADRAAFARIAAHHGAHSGCEADPAGSGIRGSGRAGRSGGARNASRLAGAAVPGSQDRALGGGVSQGASRDSRGCHRSLCARAARHHARPEASAVHAGGAAGRTVLAAGLSVGQDLSGEEGLPDRRRLAGESESRRLRIIWRRSFCWDSAATIAAISRMRRKSFETVAGFGAAQRGVQRSGRRAEPRQSLADGRRRIFARRSRATVRTRTITSISAMRCGSRDSSRRRRELPRGVAAQPAGYRGHAVPGPLPEGRRSARRAIPKAKVANASRPTTKRPRTGS